MVEARYEAAEVAREYFDSEWQQHHPDEPPPEVTLDGYRREVFLNAWTPVRTLLTNPSTADEGLRDAVDIATREVGNGARRTMLRAVHSSDSRVRWARVDPEPPTCAFCLMLISRGPVYHSRESGSFKTRKARTFNGVDMETFHKRCTCDVVPVFDVNNWQGRDQYRDAEELWEKATSGKSGKAALSAFREAVTQRRRDGEQPIAA